MYEFSGKPWKHSSPGEWHFISLPEKFGKEIRDNFKWEEEGWGRLKATAKIGNHRWNTAIWFDKKVNTYLLPVKVEVRKSENIESGKIVKVALWI